MLIFAVFGVMLTLAAALALHGLTGVIGYGSENLTTPGIWAFGVTAIAGAFAWLIIPIYEHRRQVLANTGAAFIGAASIFSAATFAAGGPSFAADSKIYAIWCLLFAAFAATGGAGRVTTPFEKGGHYWKLAAKLFVVMYAPAVITFLAMIGLSHMTQLLIGAPLFIYIVYLIKFMVKKSDDSYSGPEKF